MTLRTVLRLTPYIDSHVRKKLLYTGFGFPTIQPVGSGSSSIMDFKGPSRGHPLWSQSLATGINLVKRQKFSVFRLDLEARVEGGYKERLTLWGTQPGSIILSFGNCVI